jgi:hypothetical protein
MGELQASKAECLQALADAIGGAGKPLGATPVDGTNIIVTHQVKREKKG